MGAGGGCPHIGTAKDFRGTGMFLVHLDCGGTSLCRPGPNGHWLEELKEKVFDNSLVSSVCLPKRHTDLTP